ncbi:MAG TPA: DedA family protein [Gammaproteobacteria bacterium]|nr:DedA family protein [Gammaproteobacteria bacterium]
MPLGLDQTLVHQISLYGYWAVLAIVALESMGLPLPGETVLIAAAVFAGTDHHLAISGVITAAAAGAILGDNAGFWIGWAVGYRLLQRYGRYVRLTPARLQLGEYLFLRHGGKIVFFGRFVALLRALAALLAGANRMHWHRFLVFNALGGVVWATLFGMGGYLFGREVHRVAGPVGTVFFAAAVVGLVTGLLFVRHHEKQLEARAARALRDE